MASVSNISESVGLFLQGNIFQSTSLEIAYITSLLLLHYY